MVLFDWLFDDRKFENWSPSQVKKLTEKIWVANGFSKNNFVKAKGNKDFPQSCPQKPIVIICENNGSKDIIKHIRNGIAHGHVNFKKNNQFILLKDYYTRDSKNHKKGDLSALFFVPESFVLEMYRLYKEIE